MAPDRRGPAVIEFPNDLEIVVTREFDAPIGLVFDVFTKPEHVVTYRLAFRDQAGRDHMTKYDGLLANFDNEEDLLRSLLDPSATASE